MEQQLQIILNAKDATQGAFNSAKGNLDGIKGKIEGMESTFKKMAGAGTIAWGAISLAAMTSFKAFADAEAQTQITSQSLINSVNNLSKESLTQLQKELGATADVMQEVGNAAGEAGTAAVKLGFDDETAARSFAKLFAATKSVTGANKELALAQDLARFKNISLEDATQKLIMVHAGATKELKVLGIAVDETATAEQNLESIHKQVAGSAGTFASTTAGAMEILKVTTDNLQESIGEALAPAFQKVIEVVTPLIQKFSDWAMNNPELLAKIVLIAGAIAGLVAVMGTLGLVLPPIIAGFTFLLSPIGLILLAIAAIAFAIYMIIQNWTQIVAFFSGVWESIKTKFQAGVLAVQTAVSAFLTNVKTTWTNVWTSIKDFFKGIWDSIVGTAKAAIDSVKNFLQPIIDMVNKVINGLQAIGKTVGSAIGNAANWVGNAIGINDGIVQNGQVITTHPDDYIIATKTPQTLGQGGGGGMNVYIQGGNYLSQDAALMMGDEIIKALQLQFRGA